MSQVLSDLPTFTDTSAVSDLPVFNDIDDVLNSGNLEGISLDEIPIPDVGNLDLGISLDNLEENHEQLELPTPLTESLTQYAPVSHDPIQAAPAHPRSQHQQFLPLPSPASIETSSTNPLAAFSTQSNNLQNPIDSIPINIKTEPQELPLPTAPPANVAPLVMRHPGRVPPAPEFDVNSIPGYNPNPPPHSLQIAQMSSWSAEDVQRWLFSFTFGDLYAETFRIHDVNGKKLLDVDNDFLTEQLGVTFIFHRIRLLRDITDSIQPYMHNEDDSGTVMARFLRFETQDTCDWCRSLSFTKSNPYSDIFRQNSCDGFQLAEMSIQQFQSIGVGKMHARRFVREIEDIMAGLPDAAKKVEAVWMSRPRTGRQFKLKYKHLKPKPKIQRHTKPIKSASTGTRSKRGRKRRATRNSSGASNSDVPERWYVEEVLIWLDNFPAWGEDYRESFRSCQVNGSVLLRLSDSILEDVLGITNYNHRKYIVDKIDELRKISLRSWMREPQVNNWMQTGAIETRRSAAKRPKTTAMTGLELKPKCVLCGRDDNIMRCSKCKKAFYCSREHQVDHWPVHSQECIPTD